jgi:hypothetical protein
MPTRLETYLMHDGRTRVGAEYFNPIWADLDRRLVRLEELRTEWEAAVADLTQFGVARLDGVVAPLVAAAQTQLTHGQSLTAQLVALVEELDWTVYLASQLDSHTTQVQALVADASAQLAAAGLRLDAAENRLDRSALAAAMGITYDEAGRIASVAEQTPLGTRTTTYSYDVETGQLATIQSVLAGITRTETLSYSEGGTLAGMTAEEVAA